MINKTKILFYTVDKAGVMYYRIQSPAKALQHKYSSEFDVDILDHIDFERPDIVEFLSSYDIIYYSKIITRDFNLLNKVRANNTKFVADIDDYWKINKTHPAYYDYVNGGFESFTVRGVAFADYVTTTSELLANEVRKITGKDNVVVVPNAISTDIMTQFKDNRSISTDGVVNITYMAGSSHNEDIKLLNGVANLLDSNSDTRGKFKIILAGWDTKGEFKDIALNQELRKDLEKRRLWTKDIVKQIQKFNGNIDMIKEIPDSIKNQYRGNTVTTNVRPIKAEETAYYIYEKVLTDNYRIIKDKKYLGWLQLYEKNGRYHTEDIFGRRWTKPVNEYAYVLDETDIVLSPLADNVFNNMKSNLKQVECYTRKLPIVCSNVAPYNVDGIDGYNCMLVNDKINPQKHWFKALKKLILDEDLRKGIGENLYNSFSQKYDLFNVNEKRVEILRKLVNNESTE